MDAPVFGCSVCETMNALNLFTVDGSASAALNPHEFLDSGPVIRSTVHLDRQCLRKVGSTAALSLTRAAVLRSELLYADAVAVRDTHWIILTPRTLAVSTLLHATPDNHVTSCIYMYIVTKL